MTVNTVHDRLANKKIIDSIFVWHKKQERKNDEKKIYGTHLQHKLNEINKIKTMKMKGKRMWNAVIQHTPS